MKAILTFDLSKYEDKMAHKCCIKASDMAYVLWEMTVNNKNIHTFEDYNKKLHGLLDNHNINLEELTE